MNDLRGWLVGAQAHKRGLAHHAFTGPFGKLHFAYQARLNPMHAAGLGTGQWLLQWRVLALERRELGIDGFQRRLIKARAHAPGIYQAGVIVDRQQQRPKAAARTLGAGVADNHELLAQAAFELDPVGTAPRHVGAAGALADHAFERQVTGALENIALAGGKGFGEAQQFASAGGQCGFKRSPTLFDRVFALVAAIQKGCIEQVIDDVQAAADIECVLQRLEIRQPVAIEADHFAIQPTVLELEGLQGFALTRQALGPVVAVAGEQAHFTVANARHDAVAVELDFVAPITFGRPVHQGCQLRGELIRQGSGALGRFGFWRGLGFGLGLGFWLAHDRVAEHAGGLGLDNIELRGRARLLIVFLDQQPLLLVTAALEAGTYQRPVTGEFLTHQGEFEFTRRVGFARVIVGLPDASVPHDYIPRTVLAGGDTALETAIAQWVVFNMHRQAFLARVQAWALGHRPAQQHAIQFQAKVVMQVARIMLLNHKAQGRSVTFAGG